MVCLPSGFFLMHCSRSVCSLRLSLMVLLPLNQLSLKMMNLNLIRKIDLSHNAMNVMKSCPLCCQACRVGLTMRAFVNCDPVGDSVTQRSWSCYVMFLNSHQVSDSLRTRQVLKLLHLALDLLPRHRCEWVYGLCYNLNVKSTNWTNNVCVWWQQVCASL